MEGFLRQNTAVTITIGQLFSWADSKTLLSDALGGNVNFDPADIVCTITKGTVQSVITLAKSGSDNDMNLVSGGLATLELTANNTNTCGNLAIPFTNAVEGSEVIFPCTFTFSVLLENVYDSLISGTGELPAMIFSWLGVDITWPSSSGNEFDKALIATVSSLLDLFGEAVVYYPGGSGTGRTILAIVERGQVERLDGAPAGHAQNIEIEVANIATIGIAGTEVNTGADKVAVAKRIGGTAVSSRITRIISQDAGMMRLEIR